jgi:hypothetical protein
MRKATVKCLKFRVARTEMSGYKFGLLNDYYRGVVVKLVITSACHAEGRGFESRPPRHFLFHFSSFFSLSP